MKLSALVLSRLRQLRPSAHTRNRIVVFSVVYLSFATFCIARKPYSVSKAELQRTEGFTPSVLGVIDASYLTAYAIGQLVMGVLIDRVGGRRVLAGALVGVAAFAAAFGLLQALDDFRLKSSLAVLIWAGQGLAQGASWPGGVQIMSAWGFKARALSMYGTSGEVGGLAGGTLAAAIIAQYGWNWTFFSASGMAVTASVLVFFALRMEPPSEDKIEMIGINSGRDTGVWSDRAPLLAPQLSSSGETAAVHSTDARTTADRPAQQADALRSSRGDEGPVSSSSDDYSALHRTAAALLADPERSDTSRDSLLASIGSTSEPTADGKTDPDTPADASATPRSSGSRVLTRTDDGVAEPVALASPCLQRPVPTFLLSAPQPTEPQFADAFPMAEDTSDSTERDDSGERPRLRKAPALNVTQEIDISGTIYLGQSGSLSPPSSPQLLRVPTPTPGSGAPTPTPGSVERPPTPSRVDRQATPISSPSALLPVDTFLTTSGRIRRTASHVDLLGSDARSSTPDPGRQSTPTPADARRPRRVVSMLMSESIIVLPAESPPPLRLSASASSLTVSALSVLADVSRPTTADSLRRSSGGLALSGQQHASSSAAGETRPEQVQLAAASLAASGSARVVGAAGALTLLDVIRLPGMYYYIATSFCVKFVRYSVLLWMPFYLSEVLGYSQATAGYLSSFFEVGGVSGYFVIGWTPSRMLNGPRRLLVISPSIAIVAVFMLVFMLTSAIHTGFIVASLVVLGLFVNVPENLLGGAVAQDLGGRQGTGRATGIIGGAGTLGAVFPGLVVPHFTAAAGWPAFFLLLVAMSVLAFLALLPPLVWSLRAGKPMPVADEACPLSSVPSRLVNSAASAKSVS